MKFTVTLEGDVKAVKSLEKQILFAAKQTVIGVAQEAPSAIIRALKETFTIRTEWYLPGRKFGIRVRFSRNRDDLSARVETGADWLIDHEEGADRTAQHGGNLTIAHEARIGGYQSPGIVPAANKARRILPNASRLDNRRLVKATGKTRPRFKAVPFFVNREGTAIFERLDGGHLKLFYTLSKSVHIKHESTIFEPTYKTVQERFGPIMDEQLRKAIETAK